MTRCAMVLLGGTIAATAVLAALVPHLLTAPDRATLPADAVLVLVAEAALVGCTVWGWLVVVLVTLEARHGRAMPTRAVPQWARRLVLAACGAALVGGTLPSTALADPVDPSLTTVGRAAPRLGAAIRTDPPPPRRYVVQRGDTLWDLAEGELGEGATAPAVAAYWPRIHRENRVVIGADPDLILPGQQLRVPLPPHDREEER